MLPFLTTNSKNSNYKVNMMITKKNLKIWRQICLEIKLQGKYTPTAFYSDIVFQIMMQVGKDPLTH